MGRNLPLRGRLRALVHGRSARDEAVEAAGGSHVGGSRSNEPTQSRAAAAAAADGSPHRHLALGEYSVPQGTYTVRIRYRGWFLGVSDRVRREEGGTHVLTILHILPDDDYADDNAVFDAQ